MKRNSYRRILFALTFLVIVIFQTSYSQTLEIHQISVGQGDAGLIIVRDTALLRAALIARGIPIPVQRIKMLLVALDSQVDIKGTIKKAMLIDAGKGAKQGDKIYSYMQKVGAQKLNYIGLSHYHDDHYGGFSKIIKTNKVKVDTSYDRGYDPKVLGKIGTGYVNVLNSNAVRRITARSSSTNILLGKLGGQEIRLTTVANAGYVLGSGAQGVNPGTGSNDENDLSVAWVLQYGAFRFFTGGDLNGISTLKLDLETPIADSLRKFDDSIFTEFTSTDTITKGHVCTFKLNHHGGEESTSSYFLSVLKPKTALISCGFEKGYLHPRIPVIKDLDRIQHAQWNIGYAIKPKPDSLITNTINYYFMTSLMERSVAVSAGFVSPADSTLYAHLGDTTLTRGIIGGDLVVIADDINIATESKYLTFWNGEKATTATVVTGPVRNTNAKGSLYTRCHRVRRLRYITNH